MEKEKQNKVLLPKEQLTKNFYETYPFIEGGKDRIAWWKKYLEDIFPTSLVKDHTILDLGCGKGEIANGLIQRGGKLTCLDLSRPSIKHCAAINPDAKIFHGTALNVPFADNSFDHTISIGVLHHTPDPQQGLREAARVTTPGGKVIIFLYKAPSIYQWLFHLWAPIRFLIPLRFIPTWLFSVVTLITKAHQGLTLNNIQIRNLLGDALWTPQATFHHVDEVTRWAEEAGLEVQSTKDYFLNSATIFTMQKKSTPNSTPPTFKTRCIHCHHEELEETNEQYYCGNCDTPMPKEGNVTFSTGEKWQE